MLRSNRFTIESLKPTLLAVVVCVSLAGWDSVLAGDVTTPIEDHYFGATLMLMPTANTVWPPAGVASLAEYMSVYGTDDSGGPDKSRLAAALFFANGGELLYVIDPGGGTVADFDDALAASVDLPVDLVAAPGAACCQAPPTGHAALMTRLTVHVEASASRFGLVDAPMDSAPDDLINYRTMLGSNHAALYAPWLVVDDPAGASTVPPSAAVAGVISRIDRDFGIYKSPAGSDAALVETPATDLERDLSAAQEDLNLAGVNQLREFGSPPEIVIWGARTLTDDPELRYVFVSRFLRHLEFSSMQSLQWLGGIEPAEVDVAGVETLLQDYLHGYWMEGALQGTTPEQAYFVNCELQSPALSCILGVALLRSAEFQLIPLTLSLLDPVFQDRFETLAESQNTFQIGDLDDGLRPSVLNSKNVICFTC